MEGGYPGLARNREMDRRLSTGCSRRRQRKFDAQACPGSLGTVEEDPAAERLHAVLEARQAGAPGKAGAVVANECRPVTSSQAKFDGYLFSCPAECQCQGARERIEPGQEPQGKFLVAVVTRAAAELAQVHAAEVVFGVDRHGGPFMVPVGAVGPPARFGA